MGKNGHEMAIVDTVFSGKHCTTGKPSVTNVTVTSATNIIVNPNGKTITILQRAGAEQVSSKGAVDKNKHETGE